MVGEYLHAKYGYNLQRVIEKQCDPRHPTSIQSKVALVRKPSLTTYNKVDEANSVSFLKRTLVFGPNW